MSLLKSIGDTMMLGGGVTAVAFAVVSLLGVSSDGPSSRLQVAREVAAQHPERTYDLSKYEAEVKSNNHAASFFAVGALAGLGTFGAGYALTRFKR